MSTASRRRGQRLFGVLLGTLNKFKDDSEKRSEGVSIILARVTVQLLIWSIPAGEKATRDWYQIAREVSEWKEGISREDAGW